MVQEDILCAYLDSVGIKDDDKLTVSRYVAHSFRITYYDSNVKKRQQVNVGDICIVVSEDAHEVRTPQKRAGRADVDQYDDIIIHPGGLLGTIRDTQYRDRAKLFTYTDYENYVDSYSDKAETYAKDLAKSNHIRYE